MADIVLTTLNARYLHSAIGLRYLLANLGPLAPRAVIREFTLEERPADIVEALLAESPRIIGLGVYLWNVPAATQVVRLLRQVAPSVKVVLGGPEVSHETDRQEIVALADAVITGEGEELFPQVCEQLLAGAALPQKVLRAEPPDLARLALPYHLYDDEDIAHRMIYVEASRGCPYRCQFCLSALDRRVRRFPMQTVLASLERLIERGVRQFKFVDRSLHLSAGPPLLEFFLGHLERPQGEARDLFVHFELVPDHLGERLRPLIARFPPGSLQLEVGVQTFDPVVARRIGRKQDLSRVEETLRFLRRDTAAHVHADLIVGLPGETLEQFGEGLDRLVTWAPQEIQVGILKRLRGAPIAIHEEPFGLVFNHEPPYDVLCTSTLDFRTVQRLKRFATLWERVVNSGNFGRTAPLIWGDGSPFREFSRFTQWLHGRTRRTHGIALKRLTALLFSYLTEERGMPASAIGPPLLADYQRGGRRDRPACLSDFEKPQADRPVAPPSPLPRRQSRHLT